MSAPQCCARIYSKDGWGRASQCGNKGKVERDGKHYCGTHDPVVVQAKSEIRAAKRSKAFDESVAGSRLRFAAPDLLEAAKSAIKVIDILWVSHHANRSDDALEKLRAAILKATGESA